MPCQAGCTVVQLAVSAYFGTGYSGRLTISDVRVAGGRTDLPGTAADWRASIADANRVDVAAAAAGTLAVRMSNDGKSQLGLTSRWFPAALPAVIVGPGLPAAGARAAGTVLGNALNGGPARPDRHRLAAEGAGGGRTGRRGRPRPPAALGQPGR